MGRPGTSANDFVVDTTGHCFNCLEELNAPMFPEMAKPDSSVTSTIHSLFHLSRYLKIKMSKVFHKNVSDSIPKHLLDKVERSALKVSLCEQCARWNAKLSELLRQLEKIEVEAASYLELLHRKALEAEKNGRYNMFRKLDDNKSMDGFTKKLKLEVAEAIRGEAIQKGSLKLSTIWPKIKIKKITQKEIQSSIRRRSDLSSQINNPESPPGKISEDISTSDGNIDDPIKLECQIETTNDYSEDFDHLADPNEDFVGPHFSGDMKTNSGTYGARKPKTPSYPAEYQTCASNTVPSSGYRKLATGKLSCNLCSKELASRGAFFNHYQTKHRKIRFQCSICNKMFTLKGNLTAHQRRDHKQQNSK